MTTRRRRCCARTLFLMVDRSESSSDRGPSQTGAGSRAAAQPGSSAAVHTFLIVDVRGYTRFTQDEGDEEAARLAATFAGLARQVVASSGGEVIELRGDEALCVFRSARDALRAAVELQMRFRRRINDDPAFPLPIGIGLDAGEAVPIEGGYRGGALNTAARLCSVAGPGEILATDTVVSLAHRLEGIRFVARRPMRLKGHEKPVRVFAIVSEVELPPLPVAPVRKGSQITPRRIAAVAAAAILLMAALIAVAVRQWTGQGSLAVNVVGNSVAVIDPTSNRVEQQIPVGARPAFVAYGKHALWVANLDDNSVSHVDPRTDRVVRTIGTDASPAGIAFGAGSLWVANSDAATVSRIDPRYDRTVRAIAVREPSGFRVGAPAVGAHAVWVVNSVGTVSRLDPNRGAVTATIIVGEQPEAIAVAAGAVWVANYSDGTVTRIDPIDSRHAVTTTITVGEGPAAIAVGAGAVWVADELADNVVRIDPETNAVKTMIPVGRRPTGVAVGSGAVWVANAGDGTVSRIDPLTNEVVKTIRVGSSPSGVVAAAGSIWLTVQESAPAPGPSVAGSSGGTARFNLDTIDSTDPALGYFFTSWQLEYATCAKLLNYPDRPAPAGSRLVPEVARSLPAVSAGGRRYTFRIRDGFRFSPPSNERVTAATFKSTIERSLSPKLGQAASAQPFAGDIVGVSAYRAGRAEHIAGVVASGNTLTIELTRVVRDFPARISLPCFCAVPIGTPPDPEGLREIPSAGPYYVASYTPKDQIVLRRNPNYRGPRPHRLDEIVYTLGVGQTRAVAQIEAGQSDYAPRGIAPGSVARIAARYGSGSAAARAGRQRYFALPLLGVTYLALNTSRPLFADVNLRRAVNYAIDRPALSRLGAFPPGVGKPTDQYLPPGIPGFKDARIYPLDGPDLTIAKRLARGRGGRAVFYTCNEVPCPQRAEIVKANLKAIGVEVDVKQFPVSLLLAKAGTRGEPFDIFDGGWAVDYADPFSLLNNLLDGTEIKARDNSNNAYFDDPPYNRRLRAAARLAAPERYSVYGALDVDLARNAAPLVAIANPTTRDFFSARIGCQLNQPAYGIDLAVLCLRGATR